MHFYRRVSGLLQRGTLRAIWTTPEALCPVVSREWIQHYIAQSEQNREKLVIAELSKASASSSTSDLDLNLSPIEYLLSVTAGAAPFALVLRNDVLRMRRNKTHGPNVSGLDKLDTSLKRWLAMFFSDDSLLLDTVAFSKSSGTILEFIAQNEGVHSVKSIVELKKRLCYGKRCFSLFHSSFKNDPLAFIHVAFTSSISKSMSDLEESSFEGNISLSGEDTVSLLSSPVTERIPSASEMPTCAMFYSVNSPVGALTGLDLASRIIKRVTERVTSQHPSVSTFCTLSPVPGFLPFLRSCLKNESPLDLPGTLPSKYVDEILSTLKEHQAEWTEEEMQERNWNSKREQAFTLLLHFLDKVVNSPLMHLSVATESTADVISISQLHHNRNVSKPGDALTSTHYQDEMVNLYQREQTKIIRFAHLLDDTVLYDPQLHQVQLVTNFSSDDEPGTEKPLSDVSIENLRETWQKLRNPLLWLCHRYLLDAKQLNSNEPWDPVARFHLRNGASLHRVNWDACVEDPKLMAQSGGIMVNYLYDLDLQKSRRERYASDDHAGTFHFSRDILARYGQSQRDD